MEKWKVEVYREGEQILAIEDDSLSGIENIQDYSDTVRTCAYHLLSFIGEEPMSSKVPGMPGDFPKMPKCKPPKNPGREKSGDRSIKMLMAKDIFCNGASSTIENACKRAEEIFNHFHKEK